MPDQNVCTVSLIETSDYAQNRDSDMKRNDQGYYVSARLLFVWDKFGTMGRNIQKYADKILSFKSLFSLEILETLFIKKG